MICFAGDVPLVLQPRMVVFISLFWYLPAPVASILLAGSSRSSVAALATVRSETSIPSQSQPDDSHDWQPSVPTLDFFDADLRNPSADISDICRDLVIDSWNRRNPMQLVQLQAGGGHKHARLGNQLFTAALSVAKHMFRLAVFKTYF